MRLRDANGHLSPTPETITDLLGLIRADAVLGSLLAEVVPEPALWGASTLHFSARHLPADASVLLKLNVAREQVWWTRRLAQTTAALVPRVFAAGERLGDEPLGWVLWERVADGLHPGWNGREFDVLLEASVQFQRAARPLAAAAQAAGVLDELRVDVLAARLEQGITRGVPGPAERVLGRLDADWAWVNEVCETEVGHGDLHLANALSREGPPDGVALLLDYHPTRMPWAYDATKPEILNADPRRRGCRGLVVKQAAMRESYGLSVPAGADLQWLQAIMLGWRAMEVWGFVGSRPTPNGASEASGTRRTRHILQLLLRHNQTGACRWRCDEWPAPRCGPSISRRDTFPRCRNDTVAPMPTSCPDRVDRRAGMARLAP